ncbi:FAD/NAD(P)-binding protein [Saccharothrix longispora]|uniref:FAD/NAD(P)-binding protein n=1 Tax=Saccharothrix longispora TaxID=33920 RepID=UPI0028FD803F|nr:FAD/NAD(P)-binding protein [Saccharothrix longispora]MDU0292141.1 FAD/NAD(P)-binding protein [Saccharothrix longispora]
MVVVGAGLGGVATAIRLLRFAREPLEVVLLERRPDYRNAGVAYHRAGNHWHHVFNIQAGRMSAFREDVDDFVDWANHEADRTGWPDEWRGFAFTESGPAPRRIYHDYLDDRLAEAAREAAAGVVLVEADGEAVDLEFRDGGVDVVLGGASREVLTADHVVLATGLEVRFPAFAADAADHPAFVRHPYSEAGLARVLDVAPDDDVVIVGSLLTAYDFADLLLRRGHAGRVHLVSRSGLMLRTYPPDHRHHVLTLPPPRLLDHPYEGREDFVRRLRAEWEKACDAVVRRHPDVPREVVSERVAKSWEPYLPDVIARVPPDDLRALLTAHSSLLAVLRVGAVPYTTRLVEEAVLAGDRLSLTVGAVERVVPTGDGALAVSVSGAEGTRTIEARLVICNFGRESDYLRAESPLWASLLRKGLATAHRHTGRGVEVDAAGGLLTPEGSPVGPVTVVGSPREGDEIVRHGRTGAFTFNLAAIKNHSVSAAATVLQRLEHRYDERADDVVEALTTTSDPAVDDVFSRAVSFDVRRMAARRRADREALAARLDDSLGAIRDALGAPVDDSALRFAVNTTATEMLKDLSVTPRDLRALLGLDDAVGRPR